MCSVNSDSEILRNSEKNFLLKDSGLNLSIPKIQRRRSIDVSKIEEAAGITEEQSQKNLIAPSITISQYNSNIGLNQSVTNLNRI